MHRPPLPKILAAGFALALIWALGASYLIVFHDDVLAGFVARQGAMRDAYEARLAELQDRLDRAGRDRAGAETSLAERVAAALERQAELERRQAALATLGAQVSDPLTTGALPRPEADPDGFSLRPAEAGTRSRLPALPRRSAIDAETGLIRLEARLDGLRAAQGERLARVVERAGDTVRRLRGLIGRTGLDPDRLDRAAAGGTGGPLVPLGPDILDGAGIANSFASNLDLARRTLGDGERLHQLVAALPFGRPTRGEPVVSSPFGTRLDPFTRGLALHTGLDLRAESGEPARATAPGRVSAADYAGGYGNMVEIDHGHGVVTRFGHLARILVRPGQRVAAGDVVGLVGSTGRSTGAHLHYETRIDGEPVDPQRFLEAGGDLAAVLATD
ncbi:murein DD-endopeptidase MepM/ murein hydrolase activator NlpD [Methylobacterium brachiatum]|uniref:Murein DD-endopeptidase MepM/ murein hydrolase activator NlpD n=1 Tax=Methylobacterium brachiatum TaxID=269660 RepID=A0AAJ1TP44_9HYPH|nr:M23 family metallopeptidase [Methylobacterium brachiatum]MCB4801320.1 M23 family metallopeptidase [Methylobacterium brachiatum]MDQ0544477.1 murein DD-endopeptidase MepM/ murein hydrolase activator NlpD [Methylobacterium brachiatum]